MIINRREFVLRMLKASGVSIVCVGGVGLSGCGRSSNHIPSQAALSSKPRPLSKPSLSVDEPIDADPYCLRTSEVGREDKPLKLYRAMTDEEMDRLYKSYVKQPGSIAPAAVKPASTPLSPIYADRDWEVSLRRNWRYIVVHHSGVKRGNAAMYDRAHKARGWKGLGYHFVIGNGTDSSDGAVEVGARWLEQRRGAHAGNSEYNGYGVGVCLVGNFENTRPTQRQMASLMGVLGFLKQRCSIQNRNVIGHREVPKAKTVCPGRNLNPADLRVALARGIFPAIKVTNPSAQIITNGYGL